MAALDRVLGTVLRQSSGRLVLLSGEAGIGKSAVLRALCAEYQGSLRVLRGTCDPLFTPRPLGPFLDVVRHTGGELERLTQRGARPHEVAVALLDELRRAPTLLALEDLHWADEASLDVQSLLARRIDDVPVLVVVTHRDDELGATHPLRIVLGEMATNDAVMRMKLAPLSPGGVASLVGSSGADTDGIYRRTGGNPFFVTEVVAAGSDQIPLTVRDAVLARAARLSSPARALLDAVAVIPLGCEYWLLDALGNGASELLDECLSSGVLLAGAASVSFRHELARMAVEETLSPGRRMRLHQLALEALTSAMSPDPARLAHHAEAAHDATAVLRFAPAAAARASALGAHREAAKQCARALRFAAGGSPELLGELFDRRAYACYLSGDFPAAVEAQRLALEHHRDAGNRLRHGQAARFLSLLLRYEGDIAQAWEVGREAVDVLAALPASRELAMAYCNLAHLALNSEDAQETRRWAAKASELDDELGDDEARIYGMLNVATIDLLAGHRAAAGRIERCLHLASERGLDEHAGRAYVALAWWAPRGRFYAAADRHLDAGLRYCEERGLDLWRAYLLAYRARAELDRGCWDDAVASATLTLRNPRTSLVPRAVALAVVGLVRSRRGDPEAWEPLDEAWALARETGELQRIEPAAAARAEAYWLGGRNDEVEEATSLALELAYARGATWVVGEMLAWRRRAGVLSAAVGHLPEPFASEFAGEWRGACELWRKLDSPYEAALALADADDEAGPREALEELQRLGARPAAAIVARRLLERGARGLPRGPRPTTQANPARLTTRELEVLALLAAGRHNHEIADRLVVSQRTIDHHVSAILRKLGVRTRGQAAAEAARLGLTVQDR